MIVVMRDDAKKTQIEAVTEKLKRMNFQVHPIQGANQTVLGVIGDTRKVDFRDLEIEEGVLI